MFANALLVLVDGRAIYTPLTAGVFWEEADTVLEDLDRIEMDARLAWQPARNLEIAVIGRDLLDAHHPEAVPSGIIAQDGEVDRAVYGKLTWRY